MKAANSKKKPMQLTAEKLEQDLKKNRIKNFSKFTEEQPWLPLWMDLGVLVKHEQKLMDASKKPSQVPFYHLLSEIAPFYRFTWNLAGYLNIETRPVFKSYLYLIREFDPFCKIAEYPELKEQIHWSFSYPKPQEIFHEFNIFPVYGWSIFHEFWHLIFFNLVPCQRPEDITFYFIFFEAFVTIQEALLARQVGPSTQHTLVQIRALFNAPLNEAAQFTASDDAFARMIFDYFIDRVQWNPKTKSWEKKYWVTEYWLGHQKFKDFSRRLATEDIGKLKRFKMPSFDPEYFKSNPNALLEFTAWYKDLVRTKLA